MFQSWLEKHGGLVMRVARSYGATEEDREDLSQEILLQLWRSLPRFEGRAAESTWIYRVALNTALAWRRSEARRNLRHTPLSEPDRMTADERELAEGLDKDEDLARLYAAIQQLPKLDAALVLLYLDGLNYRQMSEVLGLSESNVGVKLTRARKALADLMKEVAHES